MILSFAWTTEALLAGRKTCTRRRWSSRHYGAWRQAWREGRREHQAWDKSPRAGGKRVGPIRLTCEPYKERLGDMPEGDVEAEGGMWASKREFIELFGGDPDLAVVVVRFELIRPGSSDRAKPAIALRERCAKSQCRIRRVCECTHPTRTSAVGRQLK